jgi:hypothetical protein
MANGLASTCTSGIHRVDSKDITALVNRVRFEILVFVYLANFHSFLHQVLGDLLIQKSLLPSCETLQRCGTPLII